MFSGEYGRQLSCNQTVIGWEQILLSLAMPIEADDTLLPFTNFMGPDCLDLYVPFLFSAYVFINMRANDS